MVFLLSLFGMFCWGLAPIFAKIGLKNVNPLVGLTLRTLFAASMILCWSALSGDLVKVRHISGKALLFIAIEAILATLVGDLAYYAAIKRGEASVVTIIMSSAPLVTILFSALFLGEQITLAKFFGASLVILGIILLI